MQKFEDWTVNIAINISNRIPLRTIYAIALVD